MHINSFKHELLFFSGNILAMFQQQQILLQIILSQQQQMRNDLETKHAELYKRLAEVEEKLCNIGTPNSSPELVKHRIKLMKELLASTFIKLYINNFYCNHGVPLLILITILKKVSVVHDSLDDGYKQMKVLSIYL